MDYSSLDYKYTNKDLRHLDPEAYSFINLMLKKRHYTYVVLATQLFTILVFLGLVSSVLVGGLTGAKNLEDISDSLLALVLFGLPIIFLILALSQSYLETLKLHIYQYYRFVKSNNLNYLWQQPLSNLQQAEGIYTPTSGLIFGMGYDNKFVDVVGNADFNVANYSYMTQSGDNAQIHYWKVATAKLNRDLPHILLDAKANNNLGKTDLPKSFKRNQIVNAEPALTDHFNLYAPEGYRIDSLSFISPDLIAILRDNLTKFNIEIINNTVYLYKSGELKFEELKSFIEPLKKLVSELNDNTDNYIDKHVDKSGKPMTLNSIAPQGQRLKTSGFKNIYIIIFAAAIVFLAVCIFYGLVNGFY